MIEICVDNFAGGGGASQGIEKALGRPVDYAINHNREAIAMHKANHPHTEHLTEDVWNVDPFALLKGRQVGLAWFSPDCTFQQNPQIEMPLDAITTKDRFSLVTVYGEKWAIGDLGMRMFTPRELFRAQGFPDDYIIDPLYEKVKDSGIFTRLSSTDQVRMCGNSVCPPVAEALVRANYVERQIGAVA